MGVAKAHLLTESATLKRVWRTPGRRLVITTHARQEMANDGILAADLDRVLGMAFVTWVERKKDTLWHVEGRDLDDRLIRIVVAVDAGGFVVKVVTAMAR